MTRRVCCIGGTDADMHELSARIRCPTHTDQNSARLLTSKCPNAGVHVGRLPLSLLAMSHQPGVAQSNNLFAVPAQPEHHGARPGHSITPHRPTPVRARELMVFSSRVHARRSSSAREVASVRKTQPARLGSICRRAKANCYVRQTSRKAWRKSELIYTPDFHTARSQCAFRY